jgi:hypothetical protein
MPKPKRKRFLLRKAQRKKAKRKAVIHHLFAVDRGEPFLSLKRDLREGFRCFNPPNAIRATGRYVRYPIGLQSKLLRTWGDSYTLEILTGVQRMPEYRGQTEILSEPVTARRVFPGQIKVVHILIKGGLSETERQSRIDFYKKELPGKKLAFQ